MIIIIVIMMIIQGMHPLQNKMLRPIKLKKKDPAEVRMEHLSLISGELRGILAEGAWSVEIILGGALPFLLVT